MSFACFLRSFAIFLSISEVFFSAILSKRFETNSTNAWPVDVY